MTPYPAIERALRERSLPMFLAATPFDTSLPGSQLLSPTSDDEVIAPYWVAVYPNVNETIYELGVAKSTPEGNI